MFLWKTRLKNATALLNYTKIFYNFRRVKSSHSQSRVYNARKVRLYIAGFQFAFFLIDKNRNKDFSFFLLNTNLLTGITKFLRKKSLKEKPKKLAQYIDQIIIVWIPCTGNVVKSVNARVPDENTGTILLF